MPLNKRGTTWHVDVVAPNGERIRRSAGTSNKALAQEFHDKLKNELWRISNLGEKPRHTWNEAVVRWLKEQSHKVTINEDKTKLRWLSQFLRDKPLEAINRAMVDRITDVRMPKAGVMQRSIALWKFSGQFFASVRTIGSGWIECQKFGCSRNQHDVFVS